MIDKKIHIIWVGDDTKYPEAWIQTWIDNHPDWDIKIWRNADLKSENWVCQKQIDIMVEEETWAGVADIMRYEILYRYGGVYVDADSQSMRPLGSDVLNNQFFAVYENEDLRPGLVTNCYMGSVKGHPIAMALVDHIKAMKHPAKQWAWKRLRQRRVQPWKTIGPKLLTAILKKFPRDDYTIFPSKLFIPTHFAQSNQTGDGGAENDNDPYATHLWGTTIDGY